MLTEAIRKVQRDAFRREERHDGAPACYYPRVNAHGRLSKRSDLLIVVDVQNGFVNGHSREVIRPIADFLQSWLGRGGLAVATRFINPPGSKWETLLHWEHLRDRAETDLVPAITAVIGPFIATGQATVIDKCSYTSLTQDAISYIEEYATRDVYVCGIDTDACVLKTAVDAFECGDLRPFVLTDLCASSAGEFAHNAGLLLASRYIGSAQLIESGRLQ